MASFEKLAGSTRAGMFKQMEDLGVDEKPKAKAKGGPDAPSVKTKSRKNLPDRGTNESYDSYKARLKKAAEDAPEEE